MPFVKLDTGILDSSLWSEPAVTCKCWITLLAMANAEGFVQATAPGIARRANLGIAETEKSLALFEAADPHSRTLKEDGKRIQRVEGGYQIINYGKYRERDYTAAERMRRYRNKQDVTRNGCNETVTLRKQKQKQKHTKDIGPKASAPTLDDWLKSLEADTTYAGINVRNEYGKMLHWCKVHGKQPTQRRFINWINRADKPLPAQHAARVDYKRNHAPQPREPTEQELAKAREIARKETEKLRQTLRIGTAYQEKE